MAAAPASTYPNFADADFKAWDTKPVRTNDGGKGKTVYLDGPVHYAAGRMGIVTACLGDDMPLLFPIRPNMNLTELTGKEESKRLNVELGIPDVADALRAKCAEFDDWCVDKAYKANTSADDKAVWYADLKRSLAAFPPEVGRVMVMGKYKPFLKRGDTKDGKKYSDAVRVKADGWFDYIGGLVREEKTIKGVSQVVVKDCVWKDRYVADGPLSDKDTKFFLYVPKLGRYTDKVPCLGEDGKPIISGTTADGKPIYKMRWVGPQDAKPHSRITPVCSFSKMYVTDSFGPTVVAKELYVKAAPPRSKSTLAGHAVDTSISAEDALAALSATAEASEAADSEESAPVPEAAVPAPTSAPASTITAAAVVTAVAAEEPASATGERVGRKRGRGAEEDDEEEEKPKKTKKTKRHVADDDF